MENHKLVLPENLNQFGYLFGGDLLKWLDEYAWIAATLDYPDGHFVTVGMDRVEFKESVREGTILKFVITKAKEGNTSVMYKVSVYRGQGENAQRGLIFTTHVTYVNIDQDGRKKSLHGKTSSG